MKIIIVGASGKIGTEIVKALSHKHEVVLIGAHSGDIQSDYTVPASVKEMFEKIGEFDALISAVGGDTIFKPFKNLEDEDYKYGFDKKFLSQIRFLKYGEKFIRDNGSFLFTSGFLTDYPNSFSIATGPLNAAVDTFVKNTAPLLPRGIRINVVSPAPIVEPGQERKGVITAAEVAKFYVKAIEGDFTGQVLRAWGGLPVTSK